MESGEVDSGGNKSKAWEQAAEEKTKEKDQESISPLQ